VNNCVEAETTESIYKLATYAAKIFHKFWGEALPLDLLTSGSAPIGPLAVKAQPLPSIFHPDA